jgi:hypothetical protein
MPLMTRHVTPLFKKNTTSENKERHGGPTLVTKRRNGPNLKIGLNSHPKRGKEETKAKPD